MKQKFIDLIPKMMKPWAPGSSGTPWSFTTSRLVDIGNDSLHPDTAIATNGDLIRVFLTIRDVEEAMEQLNFNASFINDPLVGFVQAWEVELIPSVIL